MENQEKITMELKHQLFDILSYVKDMEPGHDSTPGIFYLNYKDKHYAIKLIEMDGPTITDRDRKKYLNCVTGRPASFASSSCSEKSFICFSRS